MKISFQVLAILLVNSAFFTANAQPGSTGSTINSANSKHLFIDVHELKPGKVTFEDVSQAHAKDLAVQKKYGVNFIKYWVDEKEGLVYCLSSSHDSAAIAKTHAEAHGLLPARVYEVTDGIAAQLKGKKNLFLDIHYLGAGKVSAKDVAGAHARDLEVEKKYGVNFINYWIDEKEGVVICLSETKDPASIVKTHKEAHGLVPDKVLKVKQGE